MKVSNKEKIQILERFLRAAVGCYNEDAPVKYVKMGGVYEIIIECDPEVVTRYLEQLDFHDIKIDFLTSIVKENRKIRPIVEVNLIFERQYWREVKELENENKKLRSKIKDLQNKLNQYEDK